MRLPKVLSVLIVMAIVSLLTASQAKAVNLYCVYNADFLGIGCPYPSGTAGNICILCPPGVTDCPIYAPKLFPRRIRGTLCFVTFTVPNPGQAGCAACPVLLPSYSLERDDGFHTCSSAVDDGLDNDGDGQFDEEPCDGVDNDGDGRVDEDTFSAWLSYDVAGVGEATSPSRFELRINGSNPAREILLYDLTVPSASLVRIGLYDLAGHRIATVMQQQLPPGRFPFAWRRAPGISSGAYFLRLEGAGQNLSRKVVFLR